MMRKQKKISTALAPIRAFDRRVRQQAVRWPLPIRMIGIALALCTGAVLGMLLPVPPLPVPAASAPLIATTAFVRTGQPLGGAGRGIPRPPTGRVASEPLPAGDTLPAAPPQVAALDRPLPEERPREQRTRIRIEDAARTESAPPERRRPRAMCPGAGDLAYDGPIICIRDADS